MSQLFQNLTNILSNTPHQIDNIQTITFNKQDFFQLISTIITSMTKPSDVDLNERDLSIIILALSTLETDELCQLLTYKSRIPPSKQEISILLDKLKTIQQL